MSSVEKRVLPKVQVSGVGKLDVTCIDAGT
jgi:hypothetical protein